jgi:uncharacterized protein YukE
MAMEGMDLGAMQPVLAALASAVSELETVISSTSQAYATIEGSWTGPDANQFHGQWPSFTGALNQAHNDLMNLHQHLQSNYTAQQSASNQY